MSFCSFWTKTFQVSWDSEPSIVFLTCNLSSAWLFISRLLINKSISSIKVHGISCCCFCCCLILFSMLKTKPWWFLLPFSILPLFTGSQHNIKKRQRDWMTDDQSQKIKNVMTSYCWKTYRSTAKINTHCWNQGRFWRQKVSETIFHREGNSPDYHVFFREKVLYGSIFE